MWSPDLEPNVTAKYHFSWTFQQDCEEPKGLLRDANLAAVAANFAGTKIGRKRPKPNLRDLRGSDQHCGHPRGNCGKLTTKKVAQSTKSVRRRAYKPKQSRHIANEKKFMPR